VYARRGKLRATTHVTAIIRLPLSFANALER
jgi:hypothetical protein